MPNTAPLPAISPADRRPTFRLRDWAIVFLLVMACIQCVRADFLISESAIDWHLYALGGERTPYQERVAMMPILRWASTNHFLQRAAAKYAATIFVGSAHTEPITVEKFTSMLVGLFSLFVSMVGVFWYSRRRNIQPWWLANVLMLAIVSVTCVLRATQNYWYPYDLPNMALFGLSMLFALEGWIAASLLCFALDLPVRETSLFLLLILAPLLYRRFAGRIPPAVGPFAPLQRPAALKTAATLVAMGVAWLAVHIPIFRRFAHNPSQTGEHAVQDFHDLLFPHHWPQLFSAGGYLVLFIWLDRRRLDPDERLLMYSCLPCLPVVLYFGVWTETRVWLDWTVPLCIMGAVEASRWIHASRSTASAAQV